jgi:allantoinase
MKNLPAKFAIKSKRVLQGNEFKEAVILIEDGVIQDIITGALPTGYQLKDVHDVGDKVVMPGLVDSHVHINEPGRTEWEGFDTATRAAAAGGITTVTDMPLNCIPVTTSAAAFDEKLRHVSGRLWVDLTFWGGVVPGNSRELDCMVDQGVMGFKCFLIHSGIDDFPNVTREDLEIAMPILARRGVPLLVHAELDHGDEVHQLHVDEPRAYSHFLASRPRRWENEAIELMIELCRKYNCRVHIVHLSSSDAISAIKAAKAEGLPFTTETCPHYLTLAAEDINDGDTRFKCAPPIRERDNSDKLWQGLKDGTIDFIVSDHSPCTPELKHMEEGNFHTAWGGISSLQFGLPAIWTEAKKRGHDLATVVGWMSAGPARFLGIDAKKGSLAPGFDADIVVFDPDESFVVEASMIYHRHKVTPHEGRKFQGRVIETYVRGHKVYDNGHFAEAPSGTYGLRSNESARVQ